MAASVDPWRSGLAAKLREGLTRNVIEPWFPRSIDHATGGFLSGFDQRWRPIGAQDRLLEFQARQTRTAARLGMALPADQSWADVVSHGLRYLDGQMRDPEYGGWFALIDRSGQAKLGGTKHAHGVAYLIGAAADAHLFSGDGRSLAISLEAFDWLETTLHDDVHGGYHGWATREGKPILSKGDLPRGLTARDDDHLGHGIGLKDANVHSDMLEALTHLTAVTGDPRVTRRLGEVFDILINAFTTADGAVHYLVQPDLRPVPGIERYGYPVQTGYRLYAAARQLGRPPALAAELARRMLDHVIEWGWDEQRGGFMEGGPSAEPRFVAGTSVTVRKRPWWVQTEAAKLLLRVAIDEPDAGGYRALFLRLMAVIDTEFVDHRWGGWEMTARSDLARRLPLRRRGIPKSDIWKDASHEADMHLAAIRMLRGLAAEDPID